MKKILLSVSIVFAALFSNAQVGLEGIMVEKFYVSDEADSINADENFATYPLHVGSTTYRVYADLLPGYKVIQIFGSETHPLNIETTTSFFNDPNYGFSTYQGTSVVNTKKNTTLIDSYLTIGGVAAGLVGVPKDEDSDGNIGNLQGVLANDDPSAGLPITGASGVDGLMPGTPILPNILGLTTELDVFDQTAGSSFATSGGTVAALGGMEGATASNKVLIGQFTTDGILSFKLNIQIATPVQGESQIFVAENAADGEFQDSTLIFVSEEPIIDYVREMNRENQQSYFAYPNPCTDVLIIGTKNDLIGMSSYQLMDVSGKVIVTGSFASQNHVLNTEVFPSGIYTIAIQNNSSMEYLKFIKR